MNNRRLIDAIGPGERNRADDLASFGGRLQRATGLDPWLGHSWSMARFPEARTADGYMPGFGGAVRGLQIAAGLYPDGIVRADGPTERTVHALLDRPRGGRPIGAAEIYGTARSAGAGRKAGPDDAGADAAGEAAGTAAAGSGGAGRDAGMVPPPRIRRPVGRGGVNAPDDLLQAQRNLARIGFAPPVRGIGEPAAARRAAVRAGLRAFQQARGLTATGRMVPGDETERRLLHQIRRQQRRLKEAWQADTGRAAADLGEEAAGADAAGPDTGTGTPAGSVAARTLGARYTGERVERARAAAWAETLDRMKGAAAAATASALADAATAPADGSAAAAPAAMEKAPAGQPAGKPSAAQPGPRIDRARRREAARRAAQAEARKKVEEKARRAREDAAQARADQRFSDLIGRDGTRLSAGEFRALAFQVAEETGLMPSGAMAWSADLESRIAMALTRHESRTEDTALNERDRRLLLEGYAYLDRLRAIGRARPHAWRAISQRARALAGVFDATGQGTAPRTDDERVAAMVHLARDLRKRREESRPEYLWIAGELIRLTPGIGEVVSVFDAIEAFGKARRAEAAGNADQAAKFRTEAALHLIAAIPVAGRAVKVLRTAARTFGPKTGRLLGRIAAQIERKTASRSRGKGDAGRSGQSKPGRVPIGNAVVQLERFGLRIPNLDKTVSRRVLARMLNLKRTVGPNPTLEQVFGNILQEVPKATRTKLTGKLPNLIGEAGELTVVRLLNRAGADDAVAMQRLFKVGDTKFRFDLVTGYSLNVRKGLLGNRVIPIKKTNGKKLGADPKTGPKADPTQNQKVAHADISKGNAASTSSRNQPSIEVDEAVFLRLDFRELDLPTVKKVFRKNLEKDNILNATQIDQVVKNLEAFHKLSGSGFSLTAGEAFAFAILSAAIIKAAEQEAGE